MVLALFVYAAYGVMGNDLELPARSGHLIHLRNLAAWLMVGALICACLWLLNMTDLIRASRPKTKFDKNYARVLTYVGWGLFGAAIITMVFAN